MTADQIRALADQCICHPVSRSISEVEQAGTAILALLNRVAHLEATASSNYGRGVKDAESAPITMERFTEIAHRTASRYSHRSEPARAFYTFSQEALADFHCRVFDAAEANAPKPVAQADRQEMTVAAAEAFNNTFHKVRAEVSMVWWQRIWKKAVEWERGQIQESEK